MEDIAKVTQQPLRQRVASTSTGNEVQQVKQQNLIKEIQKEVTTQSNKIKSPEDVQNLVQQLNKAIEPISTTLSFGVDNNDIFYVSVTDLSSDQIIRRFPAERAANFLPKMQEVTGILFDSKG